MCPLREVLATCLQQPDACTRGQIEQVGGPLGIGAFRLLWVVERVAAAKDGVVCADGQLVQMGTHHL